MTPDHIMFTLVLALVTGFALMLISMVRDEVRRNKQERQDLAARIAEQEQDAFIAFCLWFHIWLQDHGRGHEFATYTEQELWHLHFVWQEHVIVVTEQREEETA